MKCISLYYNSAAASATSSVLSESGSTLNTVGRHSLLDKEQVGTISNVCTANPALAHLSDNSVRCNHHLERHAHAAALAASCPVAPSCTNTLTPPDGRPF